MVCDIFVYVFVRVFYSRATGFLCAVPESKLQQQYLIPRQLFDDITSDL